MTSLGLSAFCVLSVVVAGAPDLGDDAMRTGAPRYLGGALGGELALPPVADSVFVPHGIVRLRWIENELVPGPGGVDLDLNTDTFTAGYHHPGLFGPRTWTKGYARVQGFAANLLVDHARGGVQVPERSFGAGYLMAGAHAGASLVQRGASFIYFGAQLELLQWFQFRLPGVTARDLVLPPWSQSAQPAVVVSAQLGEVRTRMLRLHGVRAFATATGIGRLAAQPWGRLGSDDDGRNRPGFFAVKAEGGVEAGAVGPSLAFVRPVFEGGARGGVSHGLDDRERFRVGGENPWVVPLAGAAWAEWLVDHYGWVGAAAGLQILDRVVFDVGGDLVVLNDPLRQGALRGTGTFSGLFARVVARPTEDVVITLKIARGFGLPGRPALALPGETKVFVNAEWRALPWSW